MPSSYFPPFFWKRFALLFAVLVVGPAVLDIPRMLAGYYSQSAWTYDLQTTYDKAADLAEADDLSLAFSKFESGTLGGGYGDLPKRAIVERMNDMLVQVAWDYLQLGVAFRVLLLVLLLTGVARSEALKSWRSSMAGRLRLGGALAAAGFGYTLLLSEVTPVGGSLYFVLTLVVLAAILLVDDPGKSRREILRAGGIVVALATAFYLSLTPKYIHMSQYEYTFFEYMVRARITSPVYFALGFAAKSLLFAAPYLFFVRHGLNHSPEGNERPTPQEVVSETQEVATAEVLGEVRAGR